MEKTILLPISKSKEEIFLSSSIDTLCWKCKKLYPADMLHHHAGRIESYGMSSIWDVCQNCAKEHDNFNN